MNLQLLKSENLLPKSMLRYLASIAVIIKPVMMQISYFEVVKSSPYGVSAAFNHVHKVF